MKRTGSEPRRNKIGPALTEADSGEADSNLQVRSWLEEPLKRTDWHLLRADSLHSMMRWLALAEAGDSSLMRPDWLELTVLTDDLHSLKRIWLALLAEAGDRH